MNNMQQKNLFPVVFWVIFLALTGCKSVVSINSQLPTTPTTITPTYLPSPTSTQVLTLTPDVAFARVYTPPPTLLPAQEQLMVGLLNSTNCKVPCYLSITPGQTSIDSALMVLESLGANLLRKKEKGGVVEYSYNLDIGNPTAPKEVPVSSALVYQYLQIRSAPNDDTVQLIHVGIRTDGTPESSDVFRKYWSRYSTSEIFAQIGRPDELYTGTSKTGQGSESSLILVYENLGAFINLRGTGRETSICSEQETPQIILTMDLYNPNLGFNRKTFNAYIDDPNFWLPIRDALGIDTWDFFRLILAYPSICFWH